MPLREFFSPTNLNFLSPTLVSSLVLMVDAAEVGNDDGNRQSNDQHPTERTDGAKDLSCYSLRDHVSIPAEKEQEIETLVTEICTSCFYTCSFMFNSLAAIKKQTDTCNHTYTTVAAYNNYIPSVFIIMFQM